MTEEAVVILVVVLFVLIVLVARSVRVVRQDERGVVFRLGRVRPVAREPGLTMVVPAVDRIRRVSMRPSTVEVPVQDVITRDNVSMRLGVTVSVRVTDPVAATMSVADYREAVAMFALTTLRSIVGGYDFEDLARVDREAIDSQLHEVIAEATEGSWGVRTERVEIVVPAGAES